MKDMYSIIKKLCCLRGISINYLESKLGFSKGSICKWQSREPGIYRVSKVADYLGVSIYDLLPEGDKE